MVSLAAPLAQPSFASAGPHGSGLALCPVNGAAQVVGFYQQAQRTLDVYTELLGNPTLESELVAAVTRGVRVRLISPQHVNGGSQEIQHRQLTALTALSANGVQVHVNGPTNVPLPYFHARAAVADAQRAYLGSISLSPNGITFNREMTLLFQDSALVQQLQTQFDSDYDLLTHNF